jgi:hypothetical protein
MTRKLSFIVAALIPGAANASGRIAVVGGFWAMLLAIQVIIGVAFAYRSVRKKVWPFACASVVGWVIFFYATLHPKILDGAANILGLEEFPTIMVFAILFLYIAPVLTCWGLTFRKH